MAILYRFVLVLVLVGEFWMSPVNGETCPDIRKRSDWDASDAKAFTVLDQPVEFAIIAHTATGKCSSFQSCAEIVRNIQHHHLFNNKFKDIGYNFLIGGNGEVFEGTGFDGVGTHSRSYNSRSLGIAFIGNYNIDSPTVEQMEALKNLLNCAVFVGSLKRNYKLVGHLQVVNTLSPGHKLYAAIKNLDHWTANPS